MWILPLLGYLGVIIGFCFLTLAIASGLYYLSELVEEHTVIARRLLTRLIYSIIAVHVLLWLIDGFPFYLSALSIISHLVYAGNLRRFPIVKLSDPIFLASCVLVGLNHWLWFRYFSSPEYTSSGGSAPSSWNRGGWKSPGGGSSYNYYGAAVDTPSFGEIASYFGLCVWMIPFALFVSLSAGENVLPSMGSEYATGSMGSSGGASVGADAYGESSSSSVKTKSKGMAKALVDGAREWVSESGELMGFWGGQNTRRF
ncbi:erv26 superfamily protein [Microsporum canis]